MSAKNPLLCFVHIEKAAGTTLHHIFINNFPGYVTLKPWYYWSNEKGNDFSSAEAKFLFSMLPAVKAFGGHTVRDYHEYERSIGREIHYFSYLREPVSRYISHFRYQRDIMKKDWSLETFLAEPRFDNYMTRRISKDGSVQEAMDVLANKYKFTGLIEDFDTSLILMKHYLGLKDFDIAYEVKNTNVKSDRKKDERISDELMQKIREANSDDLILYDFVKNQLFPDYVKNYPGDIQSELSELSKRKEDFHFSRFNQYFSKAYQLGYYRQIERIGKLLFHKP